MWLAGLEGELAYSVFCIQFELESQLRAKWPPARRAWAGLVLCLPRTRNENFRECVWGGGVLGRMMACHRSEVDRMKPKDKDARGHDCEYVLWRMPSSLCPLPSMIQVAWLIGEAFSKHGASAVP